MTAWKNLERQVAKALGGERVTRGSDFGQSDVDVVVPDFPALRIDAKYRTQKWSHHRYLDEVGRKYCSSEQFEIPVLVTKTARERGACVCLRLEDFGKILDYVRALALELERIEADSSGLVVVRDET